VLPVWVVVLLVSDVVCLVSDASEQAAGPKSALWNLFRCRGSAKLPNMGSPGNFLEEIINNFKHSKLLVIFEIEKFQGNDWLPWQLQ
jgi:hypothetical protein